MAELLMGIDIGTSACKGALFAPDGQILLECDYPYGIIYPRPGWAEQHPEDWWSAVCAVTRRLTAGKYSPRDIAGIGICGQSWAAVAVDKAGEVLTPCPIWLDNRAKGLCEEILARVDETQIHRLAGNLLRPAYSLPKVLWFKREMPGVYRRIYKVLQSNGYIVYKLTGSMTQDVSQGYGYQCFDIRKLCWNESMADTLGMDLELLARIVPCHALAGGITARAAAQTGLHPGTPVVAGGLDATATALGCGVLNPGQTQEQGGSSGGVGVCLSAYAHDPRHIMSAHVVPGRWLLQGGTVGGGSSLKWFEQEFCARERLDAERKGISVYEQMDALAKEIPPGSGGVVFLPYMAGERCPVWDVNASGVLFGLDFTKTRAHCIRAVMEGVAYTARHNMAVAAQAGLDIGEVFAGGGAARSPLWMQIKADATKRVFHVPGSTAASALGAAMLAGVATGVYRGFEDAAKACVHVKHTYTPNEAAGPVYDRGFEIYLEIYESLKATMQKAKGAAV